MLHALYLTIGVLGFTLNIEFSPAGNMFAPAGNLFLPQETCLFGFEEVGPHPVFNRYFYPEYNTSNKLVAQKQGG